MDLPHGRSDYRRDHLDESELNPDPLAQLSAWLQDAEVAGAIEPAAMCVSTANVRGRPSARFVLLRGLDDRGLVFYTNYESRKGQEIEENPFACATFWWGLLERQVRVEGRVERTTTEESDAYFDSRPAASRLASAASPQSQEVSGREELEAKVKALANRYPEGPPRPENWGGYRIVPDRVEFWQGRSARLHDRFAYEAVAEGWRIARLAP